MGTRDEFLSMLDFLESRNIKPVVDKIFPLEQIDEAMKRMEQGDQFGKIVLQISWNALNHRRREDTENTSSLDGSSVPPRLRGEMDLRLPMKIEHIAIWAKDTEKLKDFYSHYFHAVAGEKYFNPKKNFESYFLSFDTGCRLELMQMPGILDNKDTQTSQYFGITHLGYPWAVANSWTI